MFLFDCQVVVLMLLHLCLLHVLQSMECCSSMDTKAREPIKVAKDLVKLLVIDNRKLQNLNAHVAGNGYDCVASFLSKNYGVVDSDDERRRFISEIAKNCHTRSATVMGKIAVAGYQFSEAPKPCHLLNLSLILLSVALS